jgi:hypothetical protein
MHRLFARFHVQKSIGSIDRKTPAPAPAPLSAKELKEVAGGLPRVGGLCGSVLDAKTKVLS